MDKAAAALLGAYDSRTPLPPLTAAQPDLSVSDAYAIQLAQVSTWTSAGAVGAPCDVDIGMTVNPHSGVSTTCLGVRWMGGRPETLPGAAARHGPTRFASPPA